MAVFGITLRYAWVAVPLGGYMLGKYLDDQETLRMTNFRTNLNSMEVESKREIHHPGLKVI